MIVFRLYTGATLVEGEGGGMCSKKKKLVNPRSEFFTSCRDIANTFQGKGLKMFLFHVLKTMDTCMFLYLFVLTLLTSD